jgi:DNA mismatch endonuclease (patch repair protein)
MPRGHHRIPSFCPGSLVTLAGDIVPTSKRRQMMQAVRRHGTDIEIAVRRAVSRLGRHSRTNAATLPGRPDLSNQRERWAIFVHGCFWHGHRNCCKTKGGKTGRIPVANKTFWEEKISTNRTRDARKAQELRRIGYQVLTVWECDVKNAVRLKRKLTAFFTAHTEPERGARTQDGAHGKLTSSRRRPVRRNWRS